MRIIAKRTLREFWERYPDAEGQLKAWYREVSRANWASPNDVKAHIRSASLLRGGRVVFNVGGNKYRLVLAMDYGRQIGFVRFIGTHAQYDRIDAEQV